MQVMVTRTGIEPVLPPRKGGVLAACPPGHIMMTDPVRTRYMVAETGFEPVTYRV